MEHAKLLGGSRLSRVGVTMAAQGRFGKYGDHKRKSGLRKNRALKTRLQKTRPKNDNARGDKRGRRPGRDERLF
jgi:hypothetical protein